MQIFWAKFNIAEVWYSNLGQNRYIKAALYKYAPLTNSKPSWLCWPLRERTAKTVLTMLHHPLLFNPVLLMYKLLNKDMLSKLALWACFQLASMLAVSMFTTVVHKDVWIVTMSPAVWIISAGSAVLSLADHKLGNKAQTPLYCWSVHKHGGPGLTADVLLKRCVISVCFEIATQQMKEKLCFVCFG